MIVPRLRLRLAQAALGWERVWPALWPVTALLMLFAAAASFDLLPALPGWLHGLLLLVFLAALGTAAWHGWLQITLPDRSAARRRIELDSGLDHRPLAALDDRPATGENDPFAQALWAAHRQRMAAASRHLRLGWPRAGLIARDPYALRVALSLVLLIGLSSAGGDVWSRLGRALLPQFDRPAGMGPASVDLWITPPDYTGLPPIYLGGDPNQAGGAVTASVEPGKPIAVPAGSTVLVQVHGGRRAPQLALDGANSDFTPLDASDFNITAKLGEAHHLAVIQGGSTLAAYDLAIVPDLPPTAEWTDKPKLTARGALHLDYLAKDDYGVKGLSLEIRRPNSDDPPSVIVLPVPSEPRKELKGATFQDLTPHPWAGLPVELRIIARDAIDQTGISAPLRLILPEHKFHHPVAKAIIEQRKLLTQDPNQSDAVAETLGDLAARPALFHNDSLAFMSLQSAADRLQLAPGKEELPGIQKLLWDTALRIDEGDQPEAQKALREAEQALQDALDRNAPDEEINKLMSELRQAVNRYLQAMMENAQKNAQQPADPNSKNQALTPDDIKRMLDQAQQMARSGAKDAAREALAQLQDLLENLRAGQSQPQQSDQAGQQMLQGMQDLAHRQQQLMDRAYRQSQHGQNGNPGPQGQQGQGQQGQGPSQQRQGTGQGGTQSGEGGDIAGQQEALRRQLDRMLGKMGQDGEAPQALSRAERAMRDAVDALNRNAPGEAVGQQGEALDQLQQAARELAEQMRKNGEGQGGTQNAGRDPFGRPLPGGQGDLDRGDVKIPEEADMQKSREILDELRRRASDRDRPQLERDYIDRLLKRF